MPCIAAHSALKNCPADSRRSLLIRSLLIFSTRSHLVFSAQPGLFVSVLPCGSVDQNFNVDRQMLGLLDDDWMFPGPTLEPLLGDILHPPSTQELEEREERRRRASEDARERKWKMENAEQIKKEMQESISKRLKALPPKSQSQAPPESEPEPEPESEEKDVEEAHLEEFTGWEITFKDPPQYWCKIIGLWRTPCTFRMTAHMIAILDCG